MSRTVPGTPEWARWQLAHTLSREDIPAVLSLIALCLSLPKTRTHYARMCHERRWPGQTARLVWAILEALLLPTDDDIPF